ncbi:MAG TPA: permease-like cell division protein FtsX, partial [Bacilli bacterium]
MKFSTLVRHFREGAKNVVRNGWMTFASTSAIAISLFILGVFLFLTVNVDDLAKQVESQVQVRLYLENITPDEIAALQNEIGTLPEVSKVTFVSKEEGLANMKDILGEENRGVLEGQEGDNNPLPDSFTVEVDVPRNVQAVVDQIDVLNKSKTTPPIYKMEYGKHTTEILFKVTRTIRNIGFVLVVGLAFTAMFLIANTIKLTILARRREIGIMKLVGATNSFIRWPFFVEGMILGLIGSTAAIGILLFGYYRLVLAVKFDMGIMMIKLLPLSDIAYTISG